MISWQIVKLIDKNQSKNKRRIPASIELKKKNNSYYKIKVNAIHSIEWIIIIQFGDRFIYISSKLIEYIKEHWAIFIPWNNIAQPIMD